MQVHHAVQSYPAGLLIPGYDVKTGAAMVLPTKEHTSIPTMRGKLPKKPDFKSDGGRRRLLTQDVRHLRKHTNAPNCKIRELIELNKKQFPKHFSASAKPPR